jgi:AraC family transcriptional regulator
MDASFGERPFESHLAFYEHAYGQHIAESHTLGRRGATLMVSEQSAGDWSDAPTPDLVVTRLCTRPIKLTCDIGAGRQRMTMHAGSFVVVPPGYATTFLIDNPHRGEFTAIRFADLLAMVGDVEEAGVPFDGDFGVLHRHVWRDRRCAAAMDALFREARAGAPHGALGADGFVLQLVGALIALRDRRSDETRSGLAPWRLKRALARLEDDLADDISLAEVAAAAGLSPEHFCRAFARSIGEPPNRYRLGRRIERAKELLAGTTLPVTEIALSLGFATPQHFAAAFKARVGATPSGWRRARIS